MNAYEIYEKETGEKAYERSQRPYTRYHDEERTIAYIQWLEEKIEEMNEEGEK